MIDQTVHMGLLFDFYSQLLTDKQRLFFSLYHQEDLSLGEIAEQFGVTRQAVYDILRRSQKTLLNFEEKLGLIRRYTKQRELLETMQCRLADLGEALARQDPDKTRAKELGELEQLVTQMLESF
ncbi:MAG: YlxM family DNA-binding protein [Firmicutes bacterium]|nr:YlxM family DNA-binding protein [Bacillota bacterium]